MGGQLLRGQGKGRRSPECEPGSALRWLLDPLGLRVLCAGAAGCTASTGRDCCYRRRGLSSFLVSLGGFPEAQGQDISGKGPRLGLSYPRGHFPSPLWLWWGACLS